MNGYQIWKIHRAVKMHFTSKYDLFLYNGRFRRDGKETYDKINQRFVYEFLSTKFERSYDAVEFFLSNIIYTSSDQAFSINSWDNYKQWIREKESLTKFITDDLEKLNLDTDLMDDVLPPLLKYIVGGKIMPQTAVAIDANIPFLADWKHKVYFGFDDTVLKLTKLSKFCKYNDQLITQCIQEKQSETQI